MFIVQPPGIADGKRFTWRAAAAQWIYLVVAIVNIAAMLFALRSNERLTTTFREGLREDRWRTRQGDCLGQLQIVASSLATPGAEAARLRAAHEKFEGQLRRCEQEMLANGMTPRQISLQHGPLRESAAHITAPAIAAILTAERGDHAAATMKRQETQAALRALRVELARRARELRAQQKEAFSRQDAGAALLSRQGTVLTIAAGLLILAVATLAMKLMRDLANAQQRALYLHSLEDAVAERDAQREEARKQQEMLKQTERIARIGSWDCDLVTHVDTWSDEKYRLLGFEPASVNGGFETYLSCIPESDRERIRTFIVSSYDDDRTILQYEHPIIRSDGQRRLLANQARIVRDENGNAVRVFGFSQDVTERRLDEERARLYEERFQLVARATNDIVWDWNLITGIGWTNEAYTTRFGFQVPDGMTLDDWLKGLHPDDVERVQQSLHAAVASGDEFWSCEYRYGTAGNWRDIYDRGYIVHDDQGRPIRAIGAMMDVTEQKAAAKAIAALSRQNELILNSVADGIIGIDLDGTTEFINPAAAMMLGWTAEELIGKRIQDVIRHDWAPDAFGLHKTSAFRTRSGALLPVEHNSGPIVDEHGTVAGAVVTFRDITERQVVDRMKNEFIATVSHELRTPLTSIRGALGLLADGRLPEGSTKRARLLEIAVANTDRLVRLINDILDIERMDSGKVKLEKRLHRTRRLIADAVDVVQPLAEREQITVVVEGEDLPLFGDSDRIVQTLTNLLSNAVKFSPARSKVSIGCKRQGEQILFTVTDQGRGIPRDRLERIFERFQQVDASDSRDKGGTGLGLAICRMIVRQHGGEIWAESELGRGSTFSFTIPYTEREVRSAGVLAG